MRGGHFVLYREHTIRAVVSVLLVDGGIPSRVWIEALLAETVAVRLVRVRQFAAKAVFDLCQAIQQIILVVGRFRGRCAKANGRGLLLDLLGAVAVAVVFVCVLRNNWYRRRVIENMLNSTRVIVIVVIRHRIIGIDDGPDKA